MSAPVLDMDALNAGLSLCATVFSLVLALCPVVSGLLDKGPKGEGSPGAALDRVVSRRMGVSFCGLALTSAVMAGSDTLTWVLPLPLRDWQLPAILTCNFLFNSCAAVLFLFYGAYLRELYTQRAEKPGAPAARYPFSRLAKAVLAVYLAGCAASLANHMFFSVNAETRYYRGELFWLAQALLVVLYVQVLLTIVANARLVRRGELVALLSYVLLPAAAELVQVLHFGAALVPLCVTCSIALVLVGVQERLEAASARADRQMAQERLDLMEARVDPDELYARLDEAARLCEDDPAAAARSIGSLSRWLRERMRAMSREG